MLINPSTKPLHLKQTVAGNAPMVESDAVAAKEALWRTGDYTPPFGQINALPENELIAGIRTFQNRNGLREDGEMKPGGPTERLLRASIGQGNRAPADAVRRNRLTGSVGAAGRNNSKDKTTLKNMLILTGQFDPDSPAEDEDFYLAAAIRNLQSEFGLPRTSTLTPGDEAETALRKTLALHADGDPRDPYKTPLPSQPVEMAQAVTDTEGAFTEAGKTIKGMVDDAGQAITETVSGSSDDTKPEQDTVDVAPDNPKAPPDGMEWRQEAGLHDSGLATVRTDGPIKIDEVNPSIHPDGILYTVIWVPLDENGSPQTNVQDQPPLRGGHIVPLKPGSEVYTPPFENEHGWEVRVNIRASEAKNANTSGAFLNIHKAHPKEKK